MRKNYAFIGYLVGILGILFLFFIGSIFFSTGVVADSSGNVTSYSMPADPDSVFLDQLSHDLPYSTFRHLEDSFRNRQRYIEMRTQGMQKGWSDGGSLGFKRRSICDTCTYNNDGWNSWAEDDKKGTLRYFITLGGYKLTPDKIRGTFNNQYPVYYKRLGKDSLKYLEWNTPDTGRNGSLSYGPPTIRKKALPFAFDPHFGEVQIQVGPAVFYVGFVLSAILSFAFIILALYMLSCFLKLFVSIAGGSFFVEENRHRLNVIAFGLIIVNLYNLFLPWIIRLLFAGYLTSDVEMVSRSVSDMGLIWLVLGVFFLFLAKAFNKGMKLQEEQELTV